VDEVSVYLGSPDETPDTIRSVVINYHTSGAMVKMLLDPQARAWERDMAAEQWFDYLRKVAV
jgi:sugar/nucleoside kinase (ribokinase family)